LFVRLRDEKGRRFVRSLDTTDRAVANAIALSMIAERKAGCRSHARGRRYGRHEFEPAREHAGPDCGRLIATDRELIHLDKDGRITIRAPSGGIGGLAFVVSRPGDDRPSLPVKDADDALL
jgi:hypothetical protein